MRALALLTAVFAAALMGAANAQPPARDAVEAILTRSSLERAAMRVCAAHEKDTETEAMLTRAWRLDLTESWDVLRKAGYSEGDVRAYVDRFDLDVGSPGTELEFAL